MTLSDAILLCLFGLTALNWTIHWYTQTVTYHLFPLLARAMSGQDFVNYHRLYEAQLVWSIYLPWSLLLAASVAAVLFPPEGWWWLTLTLLALNSAIGAVSVAFAVPIHRRVDRTERLELVDATGLLTVNLVRLGIASASLLLAAWLTAEVFLTTSNAYCT